MLLTEESSREEFFAWEFIVGLCVQCPWGLLYEYDGSNDAQAPDVCIG